MKKNKKIKLLEKLGLFINIILTIIVTIIISTNLSNLIELYPKNYRIIILLVAGIIFYIAFYAQLIIHELGHLIFGLLTKYKFLSFRVGNIILIKISNKLKIKHLKLAGTNGQCLMSPPELIDDKIPVLLYNFGGALLNIITALIFIGLHDLFKNNYLLAFTSDILIIFGIYFGALNGIPMKLGVIDNDGFNAISLSKDKNAQKAFWTQLKINEASTAKKRLKDMPKEWFELNKDADLNNTLIVTIAISSCNKLMDEHNFKKANKKMSDLQNKETAMLGLHQNLLICDQIYCELIEGNIDNAKKLYKSNIKKFMESMKSFPSVIRTNYTISLLLEKNQQKANTYLKQFRKQSKSYPYPSDIASERELISIATAITRQ